MHADRTFSGEMRDQVSILGADSTGGNAGGIAVSGVRQAVIGAADRADQCGYGSEFGGSLRDLFRGSQPFRGRRQTAKPALAFCLSNFWLNRTILPATRSRPSAFKLIEVVDDDYIGGDSIGAG